MPIEFTLPERLAGFVAEGAKKGEKVRVCHAEGLTSLDGGMLTWRLEELQKVAFSYIPGLPHESTIDHMVVIIRPDLSATAYVNELATAAQARAAGAVTVGDPVFASDILDIVSVDLGIEVPDECAVIIVRSLGWRKSLFFDFGPLIPDVGLRKMDLKAILAKQTLQLIQGRFSDRYGASAKPEALSPEVAQARLAHMNKGIGRLRALLEGNETEESFYQELLEAHPWMLGGFYQRVERHQNLDDANIPDFTATRLHDGFRDVIELKQPFTRCFKKNGAFASDFNDAWNQCERYLVFARNNADYLHREKRLAFSNPRCLLLVGHGLTDDQMKRLRDKCGMNPSISVLTYEHLERIARAILHLTTTSGDW